jgi:hypothetical protein
LHWALQLLPRHQQRDVPAYGLLQQLLLLLLAAAESLWLCQRLWA